MDENIVKSNNEALMDKLYDANLYIEAFNKCKKGCNWKESVQRYEINLLRNINRQIKEIKNGTYKQKPFNEFVLTERGRTRDIKAVNIDDRVIIRSLCDNILTPCVQSHLIYDNGSSVKGKGLKFANDRLTTHLHKYYRENKTNEGYILLMDFTKFFDNIPHKKLMDEYAKCIKDKDLLNFLQQMIESFRVDVSYMDNEEYAYCLNTVFNALEYSKIDKSLLTGQKYMDKSLGIGSQISQVSGLLYPTRIDNYCKIVKGLHYYGRYMDDTYVIHKSKEYLKNLLNEIKEICNKLGIFINEKKTQIVKLSKKFSFLKVRYILTDTGKVIRRVNKDSVTRERRKLKKFAGMLDEGKMSYADIEEQYLSWRGNFKDYCAYDTLKGMDKLYDELFIEPFIRFDYARTKGGDIKQ